MAPLLRRTSVIVTTCAGLALVAVFGLLLLTGAGPTDSPTFGTIPEALFEAGVPADPADLPDYISVVGSGDDVVGYVAAPYAFPVIGHEAESNTDEPIPVVDTNLRLVGHLVAGRGFVPLGTDVNEVPTILVTTTYVAVTPELVPAGVVEGMRSVGSLLASAPDDAAQLAKVGLADARAAADVGDWNPTVVAFALLSDSERQDRLVYVFIFEGLDLYPSGGGYHPGEPDEVATTVTIHHELIVLVDAITGEFISSTTFR